MRAARYGFQKTRSIALLLFALGMIACSGEEDGTDVPECQSVAAADFDADSGWGAADYCTAPTELGCFPYHESSEDTCGPFISMRTTATTEQSAAACGDLLTQLNCGTYTDEEGTALSFFVADADRFTMQVVGTYQGAEVDTVFHFNPCHQNCQAAITLKTLEPEQQRICDIPRQGKPACLFPESAHSLTFVRADEASMVIRMAGMETVLSRTADEE